MSVVFQQNPLCRAAQCLPTQLGGVETPHFLPVLALPDRAAAAVGANGLPAATASFLGVPHFPLRSPRNRCLAYSPHFFPKRYLRYLPASGTRHPAQHRRDTVPRCAIKLSTPGKRRPGDTKASFVDNFNVIIWLLAVIRVKSCSLIYSHNFRSCLQTDHYFLKFIYYPI